MHLHRAKNQQHFALILGMAGGRIPESAFMLVRVLEIVMGEGEHGRLPKVSKNAMHIQTTPGNGLKCSQMGVVF
jgi:hypothetical protein